jgi:hypothetical protein
VYRDCPETDTPPRRRCATIGRGAPGSLVGSPSTTLPTLEDLGMDARSQLHLALDPELTCRRCQALFVFADQPLRRPAPWSQLILTAVLVPAAVAVWLHHADAAAVLAAAVLLGCTGWLWVSWSRGCPACYRLRAAHRRSAADRARRRS